MTNKSIDIQEFNIHDKISDAIANWEFDISSSLYHTASVSRIFDDHDKPVFPSALDYIIDRQYNDGSWGSEFFNIHERFITTLNCLITLLKHDRSTSDYFIDGMIFISDNYQVIIHNFDNNFVGYGILLPALLNKINDYLPKKVINDFQSINLFSKYNKIKDKIQQSIELTSTYYLWTIEAFDTEYILSHGQDILEDNGSVVGSVGSSAYLAAITEDEFIRKKTIYYIKSMQNDDGGFGNFTAESLDFLFGCTGLIHEYSPPSIFQYVSRNLQIFIDWMKDTGIPFSSCFPVGDLDDTCVTMILLDRSISHRCRYIHHSRSNFTWSIQYQRTWSGRSC